MDSAGFPWSFTAIALVLPVILLFMRNKKKAVVKWPPGPKTLPIIGNMHLVGALAFRSLAELSKQYGPLMRLKLGEVETIVVSSPEITREMLKEHDLSYSDRPKSVSMKILWYNYVDIAFTPYGDYWKQMRKICINEILSPKSVRSFGSVRKQEVSQLLQSIRLSAGEPLNLSEKIFAMMFSISCRSTFGKVPKDKDKLIKIILEGIQMAAGFEIADFFPSSLVISTLSWTKWRLVMMRRRLDPILDDLIEQHRLTLKSGNKGNGESGIEDLVDVLIRLQGSGELQYPIGNDNMKAVIFDMFAAGTHTSATLIDWTMAELVRNPKVMAKAQAEVRGLYNDETIGNMRENDPDLKYLRLVTREALRLHPPVPLLPRAAREDREINGYKIPAKVRVLVNNWAMHRDPKYWTDPESFQPERFEDSSKEFLGAHFDYLPFGTGKRMCPGITFSLTTGELLLANLLYHFDWKLPPGQDPQTMNMIEKPGLTARREDSLYVVATPYNCSA